MRIIFFILFLIFSFVPVQAETDYTGEFDEESKIFDEGFDNQKQITNREFENTIKQLKERALSKKQRKMQKEVKPLSQASDFEHLKNFTNSQDPENDLSQTLTVMIPMQAQSENGTIIPPGYYKLACKKVSKDEYMLELSQGTKKIVSVPAMQTTQDLEQDTIQFCNAIILEDNRIRLMYGSIDLNLIGYLYY